MAQGRIHSIETFGSVDGPGVRFVVFVQGCALRCRYCHNADTWDASAGELADSTELLDRAERYRAYWGEEGGITVSGGEPLLQLDFLLALFGEAHERGISTCLDTALAPFTREPGWLARFDELMGATDLVLADLKHIDPARHEWLTGRGNANILDGLAHLDEIGQPVWVRHVLVPGVTDDDGYLARTAEFVSSLSNVERVEVLPYHTMGAYKWRELGLNYPLEGVEPPAPARIENAERILRATETRR